MKKLEYQQPQIGTVVMPKEAMMDFQPSPTMNPVRRREPIAD